MTMFSKTNYTDGCQCPKMLWMQRNMPEWYEEDAASQNLLEGGNEVGELAREWAGDHVLIEQDYDFERMAKMTREALAEGKTVCEATFTDGERVCMVDICKPNRDKTIDVLEVKASTKVKPYHIQDLAFQISVCESAGFEVSRASIVHLNSDYRLDGELDLDLLFLVEDCTAQAHGAAEGIDDAIAGFREVRDSSVEPDIAIGKHCNSPHACPYQKWCWRDVPENSVFSLASMGKVKGFKYWSAGFKTFEHLLREWCEPDEQQRKLLGVDGKVKLNDLQKAQAEGRAHIDAASISKFLEKIHFPLYFLDFETIQPAVPIFQGTKPYQQVPTQYSLHWIDEAGGELHHAEYLAPSTGDPRRGVAESLVEAIPSGACVTAYNMSFEKGRIKELAGYFEEMHDDLMAIHDSIVDLMVPFRSGCVYFPAMGGSYSIKKVLPALFPDDPELDYRSLEGVHNGAEAIQAFMALSGMSAEDEARTRERLLRYCELDTLAMVRVWEWLVAHSEDAERACA